MHVVYLPATYGLERCRTPKCISLCVFSIGKLWFVLLLNWLTQRRADAVLHFLQYCTVRHFLQGC